MTIDDGAEKLIQKEEIELISDIPFSRGPFVTKKGERLPLKENLYLNTTMRRFLLGGENEKTGTIDVGGEMFRIRQARHSVTDGRLRNIVHPDDVTDIKEFLSEQLKGDSEIQEQTGIKFHCGEFKTKKGARFPEGRTIYATAELRKLLEVKDITGTIVIDGKKYKVRQARRLEEGDEFVNVGHPVEEPVVQSFLMESLHNLKATLKEVKEGVEGVLNSEKR